MWSVSRDKSLASRFLATVDVVLRFLAQSKSQEESGVCNKAVHPSPMQSDRRGVSPCYVPSPSDPLPSDNHSYRALEVLFCS